MRLLRLLTVLALIATGCQPVAPPSGPASASADANAPSTTPAAGLPSLDPALIGAAHGADPLYPDLGNGGYDVESYDIAIRTDPATDDTTEHVTITAVASQRLGRFSLDYSGLPIAGLTVDGEIANVDPTGQKLTIQPTRILDAGHRFVVAIEIAGRPMSPRGEGWTWQLGTQTRAFGLYETLPTWLPFNADPADKALVDARITVPRPFVAVAPGILQSTTDADGGREFHWQAGPTSQVTIAIRDYAVVDMGESAGIPIRSYEPPDPSDRRRAAIAVIPSMLAFLSDAYGPFPFDELNLVYAEGTTSMEGPDEGMLVWGPQRFEAKDLAHHLTHIWFQVNATPATAQESYLRAAFANYADLLWTEHADGIGAREALIRVWYRELGGRTEPPATPTYIAMNVALFLRGPLSLHALRLLVGDTAFFRILQTWTTRFHRSAAHVDDFVSLAEEVSGRSLAKWAQRWLRQEAVPPISELGLRP